VSDGAGGHGGGDVASKIAVRVILTAFREAPDCSGEAIDAALTSAHHAIVAQQPARPELAGMRATATVLAIDSIHNFAVWGHVGDTRLYCFREGAIVAQTKDHSVVQKMVDAGYLAQAAIRKSTERSKLFAALGHNEAFAAAIGTSRFPIRAGDVFLLCTDGFWEYVDESTMLAALSHESTAADGCGRWSTTSCAAAAASRTTSPRSPCSAGTRHRRTRTRRKLYITGRYMCNIRVFPPGAPWLPFSQVAVPWPHDMTQALVPAARVALSASDRRDSRGRVRNTRAAEAAPAPPTRGARRAARRSPSSRAASEPQLTPAQAKAAAQKLTIESISQLQNGDEPPPRSCSSRRCARPSSDLAKKLMEQIKADAQKELGPTSSATPSSATTRCRRSPSNSWATATSSTSSPSTTTSPIRASSRPGR
jgi:serine/threonine protein phosphatase PrpC